MGVFSPGNTIYDRSGDIPLGLGDIPLPYVPETLGEIPERLRPEIQEPEGLPPDERDGYPVPEPEYLVGPVGEIGIRVLVHRREPGEESRPGPARGKPHPPAGGEGVHDILDGGTDIRPGHGILSRVAVNPPPQPDDVSPLFRVLLHN